jgi:hypothetical protein
VQEKKLSKMKKEVTNENIRKAIKHPKFHDQVLRVNSTYGLNDKRPGLKELIGEKYFYCS